ncbi:hypothetical protein CKAN_00248600 [Cinnamomum micranthum f. kanehirae]|uniref:Uncharacterized protein n=1 Tax=Cinnamomum micranthum f. kanehirae TaxID=337451 RepID=A0A443N6P5_9MAGN|nr:hypothetical protein CKAN_00248600 [Cinnamomum micranthum f. kanehirae]
MWHTRNLILASPIIQNFMLIQEKVLLRRGMYAELPWRHHSVKSCSRSSNLSMKRRITFPLYLILRVLLFHVKLQFQDSSFGMDMFKRMLQTGHPSMLS